MLDKEVYSSAQFAEYARKNLVLVQVDFPARKPQSAALKQRNTALKAKYDIHGFPTVVLLSSQGEKLGEHVGYGGGGPKPFLAKLEKMRQH